MHLLFLFTNIFNNIYLFCIREVRTILLLMKWKPMMIEIPTMKWIMVPMSMKMKMM